MAKTMNPGSQGISSNKLVRPGQRLGANATGVRPGYPDNLGNMRGSHVMGGQDLPAKLTPMQTMKPPISVPLGNELATNVGKGGPGTGRVVRATGTQGMHGGANPGERKPIVGPDPLSPWQGSNNAARRSPVVKAGGSSE
jgi:hypothetical protein